MRAISAGLVSFAFLALALQGYSNPTKANGSSNSNKTNGSPNKSGGLTQVQNKGTGTGSGTNTGNKTLTPRPRPNFPPQGGDPKKTPTGNDSKKGTPGSTDTKKGTTTNPMPDKKGTTNPMPDKKGTTTNPLPDKKGTTTNPMPDKKGTTNPMPDKKGKTTDTAKLPRRKDGSPFVVPGKNDKVFTDSLSKAKKATYPFAQKKPAGGKVLPGPGIAAQKEAAKEIKNDPVAKASPPQRAALDRIINQQPLTGQDRQALTNMMFSGQLSHRPEFETALSHALADNSAPPNNAAEEDEESEYADLSYVRVLNRTGEKLKVWVQYCAPEEPEPMKWSPIVFRKNTSGQNEQTLGTLIYNLDPGASNKGKAYDLIDGSKQKIQAYAVRIWACTPSETWWVDYRDRDLVLANPDASRTYIMAFKK